MQPFPAEPAETTEPTNILTDPAYRANNDPPGCSISLVIQGRGATERGHFVVDFGAVQVASVLSYRGTTSRAGAYQEARTAAWTWHDHDETTYAITVDPAHEAAERWFAQADEADLTRTLASARDLARDLGVPLILRDEAGFIRGHVDADGGYRMV